MKTEKKYLLIDEYKQRAMMVVEEIIMYCEKHHYDWMIKVKQEIEKL